MTDQALIFEAGDPFAPGAHVLIIGIGAYDHLIGGPTENFDTAAGMRQLSSPPRSARAMADWFLDGGFQNPEAPLASVALVISEAEAGPYPAKATIADHPLPDGRMATVEEAVDAWTERSAAHPDNLAIFYFTGHGVSAADPLLLCRDFGRSTQNPYRGAINFGGLKGALATRDPARQLFFLDACRTPVSIENAVMGQAGLGNEILAPVNRVTQGRAPAQQSVHFATSSMASTYGRTNGVTYFTGALLDALSGGGASSDLDWWVGTNGLQLALAAYTQRAAAGELLRQIPTRTEAPSFPIHRPADIRIPLNVTCDPDAAWGQSMTLEVRSAGTVETLPHDPAEAPHRRAWSPALPSDFYSVTAMRGAREAGRRDRVLVVPPLADCRLPIGGGE